MKSLLRVFRFLSKYRSKVAVSLILLLFASGLSLVQPKLVERVVDLGVSEGNLRVVVVGAFGIFLFAVVGGVGNLFSGMLLVRAGQGMEFEMRNALFRKILSFSFANLDKWRTGELLVRVNSDVNTVRMFIRMGLLMIIQSIIMLAGSLTVMFLTNVRLSIIMAIILPGTLVFFFVSASFIRPMFLRVREKLDEVNNAIQENLAGAKVVRAFARQQHAIDRFDENNRGYLRASLRVGYVIAIVFPFLFFLGQVSIVLMSWFGGTAVIENILNPQAHGLTLGQLLAFNNYALLAMWPIMALGMVLNFISRASASAERIEDLLAETPDVVEKAEAIAIERFSGAIDFTDVKFAYGEGENAVDGVDLSIRAGEKIGILGRTGSGKSSLAYLIPRFYDPDAGSVAIDGTDVRDISLASLRERISLVLQETVLVSGTIRENIGFANPAATQEEIEWASDLACVSEIIAEKEDGWDEQIGERGTGLSGGQRQRIAIARAILSDPDILILDDVTSSVDAKTEKQVVANLYRQLEHKTVLIISQKINTIILADRIVLVDAGGIVDTGTHKHLLESNEMYAEIFETQSAVIES